MNELNRQGLTIVGAQVVLEVLRLAEGLSADVASAWPGLRVRPSHVAVVCRVRCERLATELALHKQINN